MDKHIQASRSISIFYINGTLPDYYRKFALYVGPNLDLSPQCAIVVKRDTILSTSIRA